jgi:tetrahydromethanopterin S-methyltransferase subunit D
MAWWQAPTVAFLHGVTGALLLGVSTRVDYYITTESVAVLDTQP